MTIREQYENACRAHRIKDRNYRLKQNDEYEHLLDGVEWLVEEYALISTPPYTPREIPREENRIIGIKDIDFVWRDGKFHRCVALPKAS